MAADILGGYKDVRGEGEAVLIRDMYIRNNCERNAHTRAEGVSASRSPLETNAERPGLSEGGRVLQSPHAGGPMRC